MDQLAALADLIRQRSTIDHQIAAILNRPVHSGHFGEYVTSAIFGIELNDAANAKAIDGYFRNGPLEGRSVNVKYQTRHRGLLNLGVSTDPADHPDFYLVVTGTEQRQGSSGETTESAAASMALSPDGIVEAERAQRCAATRRHRLGLLAEIVESPCLASSSIAWTV